MYNILDNNNHMIKKEDYLMKVSLTKIFSLFFLLSFSFCSCTNKNYENICSSDDDTITITFEQYDVRARSGDNTNTYYFKVIDSSPLAVSKISYQKNYILTNFDLNSYRTRVSVYNVRNLEYYDFTGFYLNKNEMFSNRITEGFVLDRDMTFYFAIF
jgi:hypothetical protein